MTYLVIFAIRAKNVTLNLFQGLAQNFVIGSSFQDLLEEDSETPA
jgi:hypothetical protein